MKKFFFTLLFVGLAISVIAQTTPFRSARFPGKTVLVNVTDVTAPTLSSASIATNGTTITLNWSESVTRGAGWNNGDMDVDGTVTNNVLTYVSGDGTATWTMTAASTINAGESVNLDFNGDANSIEDGAGNDLAAITNAAVTNNSTAGGSGPTVITANITTTQQGGNNLFTFSGDCTGANFVEIFIDGFDTTNAPAITAVTLNGSAMTVNAPSTTSGGIVTAVGYRLISPPSGSQTISITFANNVIQCRAHFIPMSGVNTSTPEGTGVSASGTGTAVSVTVSSATGELVLAVDSADATTATPGGGQTTLATLTEMKSTSKAGAASVASTWTLGSSGAWVAIAVPIKP